MKRLLILPLMMIGLMGLIAGNVRGSETMIEKGKTVLFDYVLTVDGEEIDSSKKSSPLTYVHGEGNIVPGLERQLDGLKAGDQKAIVVSPDEGYGPINPEAFREIPKSQLPPGMEPQAGAVLTAKIQEGREIPVVITDVRDDSVMVDFNHPLAGKELHFDVTIVEIK